MGPGEQDILDAIEWAKANFNIDEDRIYLSGFSMGGRGTYIIGLKNPDIFAAIAPMGPATDMFEIHVRRPQPAACKEGMVGGPPGASPFVTTMYYITSGRFLLENAYNLSVFHGHGFADAVAFNIPNTPNQYLHGYNVLMDTTWSGCHGTSNWCFGHTPTLSELHARHPNGYDWAYMFSNVPHTVDERWVTGTPIGSDAIGIEDTLNPGNLIGMMEFLSRHRLVRSPDTVVYKSYTDEHKRAYWTEISIHNPWNEVPGGIRAARDINANSISVELSRVDTVGFDLGRAGLTLSATQPLLIIADSLIEPTFDPALMAPGEPLEPVFTLKADFSATNQVIVLVNGDTLAASMINVTNEAVMIGPIAVNGQTTISVFADNVTGVKDSPKNTGIPSKFSLEQNYPNPFNPTTNVEFGIGNAEWVTLKIYDLLGREVKTLVNQRLAAGQYTVRWDGTDEAGQPVGSGVYLYRLKVGNRFVQTRKMVLLR